MPIVLLAVGAAGCYLASAVLLATARRAHPPDRPEWRPTVLQVCLHQIRRVLGVALTVAVVALLLTALRNPPAHSAPVPTTTLAPYEYIPVPAGPPSSSSSSAGGGR
jgi:hypothetical protein